ncbi:MAG: hypothetical protein HQ514_04080 [Rhodospirillales bacterium]|nr:hypothetical protein [Rhodospirillales bacterium]
MAPEDRDGRALPVIRKQFIRICATVVLAAVMVVAGAALPGGDARARKPVVDNPDGTLLATEYYSMLPFVIPVIEGRDYTQQLTLVLALGLFDDKDRDELRRVAPKFRDAIYQLLFKLVMFRTTTPRIPSKKFLERKLFPVVKKLGGDMVKSIKVHQMLLGPRP